jgi:hypothetical protein
MGQELNSIALSNIQAEIEGNSVKLESVIKEIIDPYCRDLDKYVAFIRDCLKDGENPPTTDELDDFCLNLSTLIYFAGGMCEQLGIRDDIAKALYREVYNTRRSMISTGTIADKDSIAELESQQERLTNLCYSRAYKIVKSKVESAQELLSSCKKVLTRRMSEYELTKFQR